ncbi:MAG: protein kinase [Candidatus Aminicenantes bacterium]|nr:protein kinase [Candidatus Aminicenantes bacterium]NIM79080.1 protein kinase [Candidatus Aminicenantes bacterium]NIN18359.1 protein kinase [Candidatus Aminicenantes bacterium]NIN42246.1 protein kinase [Candidatus Aminicenantes bacterium]NIN85012.1 protein kinase [Candidatus Aminicenantes bacterium]
MRSKTIFKKRLGLLLGLCFWGIGIFLCGLDPAMNIHQYNLEVYTTGDGLPQSSVLSMVQTSDGYLWLATYEGIARFDGIRFRVFNTANTPEMASNRIKSLLEDTKGNLWIGTSEGLLCYSHGTFKNYTTREGLSGNFVLTVYEDRVGRLWVGTTHGLNRIENNTFTAYTREHGLSRDYISALVEDNDSNLWIGTSGKGLNIFRDGKTRIIPRSVKGLPDNVDIRTLYKDRQGRIWIGTSGHGLAVGTDGTNKKFRVYSQKHGLSGNDVRAIFQDSHGTIWIGTNGQGLNTFKNGVFTFSDSQQGFLNSPIRSILEDREGSLWIGTRDGLSQLKEGKFIIYNKRNGLPVDSVRTVFQDRFSMNTIWLGMVGGGLVRFKEGQFKTFGFKQGLKSEHIWTIAQSRDGSIWFGTYGGGVHRLKDDKILTIYTTQNGLSNNVVRAIFVDRDDNVWVGTNGGGVDVINISKGRIVNYNTTDGLSDDFVYAISGDHEGNIWIGTYSGDLNRFRAGEFTVYSVTHGLPGQAIWSIYVDRNDRGVTWIGTDDGGLIRFKDNKFTRFTIRDGLYSNLAFVIFEDQRGNLWMNCNQGIYSVRKKDLLDLMEGKIRQISCFSFGRTEGIKSTECNGPAQPAGICTRAGKLWFPTKRGAVVMDPKNVKTNRIVPPVILEQMRVDGKVMYSYPSPRKRRIILPPGAKRVEFKFTGLSFVAPHRVRFKYKLVGFDEQWLEAGTQRQLSYTNIKPGGYTFRVAACNNDGIWNNDGVHFSFNLEPFFWQTWWFRLLIIVVFAFFSYMVINFVKKHLKLIAFWKKKKYIGSYEIDGQIGMGGMGVVYKVHSLMDKTKIYALKVMREEYLMDEAQKKRFKNESLLMDKIDHFNIVKVYERGEDKGQLYIVMELLEGQTLADRYKQNQYPNVFQCIHLMEQLADILVEIHQENIIHRDLKPENIMLISKDGDPDYVKLLDFGIARVPSFSHLTVTGEVLGTVPYMSPEVLTDGSLSSAVDVYCLGVIGYEMLTRRKPFTGDKPLETIREILTRKPLEPSELNPDVPPGLNDLILKMIDKDSANRPDAREVLTVLTNLV